MERQVRKPLPSSQEADLKTLGEGEWEGKMAQGHICLLLHMVGCWQPPRAHVGGSDASHSLSLRQCQPRGAAAPPIPENQRHPSTGEEGGSLIINSAGGKVRLPARSGAPSPIIMPARLSSARAHAESLLLYFGLFSVSSAFYATGRVRRGQSILPQLLSLLQSF